LHSGKQHGLSEDITINEDIKLVILTDSSSNDFKQHKVLKDRGIDVLVIDHHECDEGYSPYAVVINNQLSHKIKNKNSCGAFVTYKFTKALDDYLFIDKSDKYNDLNMWGNIADVMDLHEKETRYYVSQGFKNIDNLFLKALMEIKSYELENKLNITSIGWTLSPPINGTLRSGTGEEKRRMLEAFISDDYEFCLDVAKMCKNVKSRQDSAVKSALKKIELKIKIKEEDRCIILNIGKTLKKSHTGLVAGKITSKYKLPTLLYRDVESKKGFVGGSFRGIDSISTDTRIDILNSKLVVFAEGHGQAGGWQCDENKLDDLKKYLNDLYKDKEIVDSKEHLVDFILEENQIDEDIVNELAQLEDEFGNGLDIPLIAFKDIELNLTDNNLKGKLNIVFYINDVKFIRKFSTNVLKQQLINNSVIVNIIGKCTMDTYNNSGQVEIVDIEIK
jgi:single-stranded-DNA-specific exonuclease